VASPFGEDVANIETACFLHGSIDEIILRERVRAEGVQDGLDSPFLLVDYFYLSMRGMFNCVGCKHTHHVLGLQGE
jgi:hypothetical protein